jgi:putative membrane protein
MIVKRNFNLITVFANIKFETIGTLAMATLVWWLQASGFLPVALPFSIAAILGSALAIFVAFRNQSSYGRWWEARTIWGGIVNNSRIFARQIIANADHAVAI